MALREIGSNAARDLLCSDVQECLAGIGEGWQASAVRIHFNRLALEVSGSLGFLGGRLGSGDRRLDNLDVLASCDQVPRRLRLLKCRK